MSKDSAIGWTEHSWNPVTGCTKVSPGCDNCYAEAIAERFKGAKAWPNGFDVTLHPERLQQPLKWRKPARIFVNSMSDLFHRAIPDEFLVEIWAVMSKATWHEFQVLTKRPHRMDQKILDLDLPPMPNIWLGVSAEDQTMYDSRIEPLMEHTEGHVLFVSAEPLLGPIDLRLYENPLDWVIVGGESGVGRRPMDYDWARDIRDQCADAGVPFFYKQGNHRYPGKDRVLDFRTHDDYPMDLEFTAPSGQRELAL